MESVTFSNRHVSIHWLFLNGIYMESNIVKVCTATLVSPGQSCNQLHTALSMLHLQQVPFVEMAHLPTCKLSLAFCENTVAFLTRGAFWMKRRTFSARLKSSKPSLKFPISFWMNSIREQISLSQWTCFIAGKMCTGPLEIHFENLQLLLERPDSRTQSCSCPAVLGWGNLGVSLCQPRRP